MRFLGDCYICGEETDKGKKNFALGEWIYLCCRACDDEYDPYEAESFDAEVKDRHPTLSKKAKSEYVFPERKAYPIGDERHAMLALVYSTWPNNKKDASEVRRKVFQRYPQLRTEFMDGKYETRNAESFDAERYKLTPKEIQHLVKNLRAIWTKHEKGVYDEDEVLQKLESLLYNTGVMQEGYGAESFDADWDNAPYGSWDEAWSDEISFPMGEKPEKLWLKNLSVIAVLAGAIWVGKQTRK